jgi:CHASE3 domain sensor protein
MKNARKIIALSVGMILLVAVVVITSFWAFGLIEKIEEARQQNYAIIIRAHALQSDLLDAETGQRGYLLTGNEIFLQPYLEVRDSIISHLNELHQRTLAIDSQEYLRTLDPLIHKKLALMAHSIELRRNQDTATAFADMRNGESRKVMDSIRTEMGSFVKLESVALAQHNIGLRSSMRYLFIIIVIMALLMLILVLSFVNSTYRETQHQLKNSALHESQRMLEVQKSTSKELQLANVTLQVSEEKLLVTLRSIGDGVMVTDANGCVISLNPIAEELTGWTMAEAMNHPVEDVFCIFNETTREASIIPVRACYEINVSS